MQGHLSPTTIEIVAWMLVVIILLSILRLNK
jgi:hypothetical protein